MARKTTINNTAKFILNLCGIWPGASCVLFCRIFWVVTMAVSLFYHYQYLRKHLWSAGFSDLMDCFCLIMAHIKVISKCIAFWLNQRKFVQLLTMMTEDWSDCANSNIATRKTTEKANVSDRITNMIFMLHTFTIFTYCLGVVLTDVDITDQTTELPFFTKFESPFPITTQLTYRLVLLVEFVHLLLCAWTAGITNVILLVLILHIGGQIDILCYWLMQIAPHENKSERESTVVDTSKIIQKHQKIINFSKHVESLYTYIALMQFVSNTIMICSLGFLIVSAIGTPNVVEEILRSLFFYTITNLEAFIFCFAGEYLNNKSKEVGVAVYNCAWYNLKSKDIRVLLFIMKRSQRQLTLTVGKMTNLSLETFTSIMNASGSYLSVLLAM